MNCPNCRAALPPGSRFCNRCGVTMAPPQAAPQERTQAYNPGQVGQRTQYGQPRPYAQTGQYGQPAPGYAPPPLPEAPARKPVWLLALILALVAGGVTAGTLFLVKGRQQSVVSNETPLIPSGDGAVQSSRPGEPGSGGPVQSGRPGRPGPGGAPVTSAPGKPGSDMAPSIMMGEGGKPGGAPSVVQAPTGPATPAMPVQSAPAQTPKPSAPIQSAPRQRAPSSPPVVSAPPQLPPTANAIDRYLAWLQYAEAQRAKLSEQANMMQAQEYAAFMDLLFKQASGDVSAEDDRRLMQLPQEQLRKFYQIAEVQATYWQSWLRSKPPVPEDCRYLDKYYTDAGLIAMDTAAQLKLALARNNLGAVQTAARRQGLIDQNLRKAQQELAKVRDVRRLPIHWDIQVGGGGGISGFPSIPGLGF